MPNVNCVGCGSDFVVYGKRSATAKYCNQGCYMGNRWAAGGFCPHCNTPTSGRRFCSTVCQRAFWNSRESGRRQTRRKSYWERKNAIVETLGGKCVECGNSDKRVLDIDHIDAGLKNKPLHRRYPTQIRVALWEKEMGNLQLLCANCHRIKTHRETWKTEGFIA